MKRTRVLFVILFAGMVSFSMANPLIGGFSLSQPVVGIATQPYNLYYYPGFAYEFAYSPTGWSVAAGWSIAVPWMNFSQIPLAKDEIPVALAIAKAESDFQNYSRSRVGAEGLMQFMPSTAEAYGVSNPFDPYQSVQAALNYVKQYEKRFSSLKLAVAAYNAGPKTVTKYKGVPPYAETKTYVAKVMKYVDEYSNTTNCPDIYARLGIFAEYSSTNEVTLGVSYPLPPGEIDLCPEVTMQGTKVSFSWIWRINVVGAHIALKHTPTFDELEFSDSFGPLTAVLGRYEKGVAASGILNLWKFKVFGSVSQWGDLRYGLFFNVFGINFEGWKTDKSYAFMINGRW